MTRCRVEEVLKPNHAVNDKNCVRRHSRCGLGSVHAGSGEVPTGVPNVMLGGVSKAHFSVSQLEDEHVDVQTTLGTFARLLCTQKVGST